VRHQPFRSAYDVGCRSATLIYMSADELLKGEAIREALRIHFPDATEQWLEEATNNLLVYAAAVTEIVFRQQGIDPEAALTDVDVIPTINSERRPPP